MFNQLIMRLPPLHGHLRMFTINHLSAIQTATAFQTPLTSIQTATAVPMPLKRRQQRPPQYPPLQDLMAQMV